MTARHAASEESGRRETVQVALARSAFLIMAVASVAAFVVLDPPEGGVSGPWGLRLIAFVLLACLPTWLYVRFLSVKLSSIYTEYVLNLHRLGVDQPANLPEPPYWSEYHDGWLSARRQRLHEPAYTGDGREPDPHETVYDRKFQAYFGRRREESRFVGPGSLLPVVVAWVAISAGWLTILIDPSFLEGGSAPATLGDALRFGFMGAYLFSLQLIVRAYFQNDLRSGTYVGVLERLVVVLVLVSVMHVVWASVAWPESEWPAMLTGKGFTAEAVVAFVIGSFPLVGQQWLNQLAASRLRSQVQSLEARHPLSDIDGMNVWYQARLLEEGIEDVQNLATANIVDVVLHSRAPVGRIVDWMDQAMLLQHLPPTRETAKKKDEPHSKADKSLLETLDDLGVRTATDLLDLYSPLTSRAVRETGHDVHALWPRGLSEPEFQQRMLDVVPDRHLRDVVGRRMLAILRCLSTEPNLGLILNWQTGHGHYKETLDPADVDVRAVQHS